MGGRFGGLPLLFRKAPLSGGSDLHLGGAKPVERARTLAKTQGLGRESDMAHGHALQIEKRDTRLPAEAIEKTVDVLVIERQQLRDRDASPEALEANRRAIAYWQHELALARHAAHQNGH